MKKTIAFLLCLALFATPLLSCAGDTPSNHPTNSVTDASAAGSDASASPATASLTADPGLPERDLGGGDFTFYTMGRDRNVNNYSIEIFAENETGDPINDAVYARNRKLEEKYNFNIKEVAEKQASLADTVNKSLMAGEDLYQVFMMKIPDAAKLTNKGMLVDLYKAPHLNFNQPWWDSSLNSTFTVAHKLNFAAGDMNLMLNNSTWAVFFNKKLISTLGLEMPYNYVKDNTWTIDKFYEMQVAGTRDLDGDPSTMNLEEDMWGMVGDNYNTFMLYFAGGGRVTRKDKDDIPYLDQYTERSAAVIDKVMNVMLDDFTHLNGSKYTGKYANVWSDLLRKNFREDRALFYVAGMLTFTLLRDMESEFGMVPMPKFDSAQPEYITTINNGNCNTVSIPITNQRLDDTALILEAMVAESSVTIKPAYYEVALQRKYMRDEESRSMLDIILSSRTFDLAVAYDWGGAYGIFDRMTNAKSRNFASECEKVADKAKLAIEKTVAEFTANS